MYSGLDMNMNFIITFITSYLLGAGVMYFLGSDSLIPIECWIFSARYLSESSALYAPGAGVIYFLGAAGLIPMECWIFSAKNCSDSSAL